MLWPLLQNITYCISLEITNRKVTVNGLEQNLYIGKIRNFVTKFLALINTNYVPYRPVKSGFP